MVHPSIRSLLIRVMIRTLSGWAGVPRMICLAGSRITEGMRMYLKQRDALLASFLHLSDKTCSHGNGNSVRIAFNNIGESAP